MWLAAAEVARSKADGDNTGFYEAKLFTARYYVRRLMPQTRAAFDALRAGSETLMELDAASF